MEWYEEFLTSFWWILETLLVTAVAFTFFAFLVVKFTHWGNQFWQLSKSYLFSSRHGAKSITYFVVIIFFNLLSVRINLVYSQWYNNLYSSLQEFNQPVFWHLMVVFAVIASFSVINALITYYISQRFIIQWRQWLNESLLEKWMDNRAYYKTQHVFNQLENPDQRIQQDVESYVKTSLSFATGIITATVSIIAFTAILWNLSGSMTVGGTEIPHAMVFLVFSYVLITSLIAFKLGRPLIDLNFDNEKLNANYRYSLIRIKEYAECVAFYAGEKVEKTLLYKQFSLVIDNVWKMVHRTLKFTGFNVIVSQVSVVFPLLIQINRYFAQQIKLGDLMQTMQVFGQLHSNLSFFRTSYDQFAAYRATLDRLTGFNEVIDRANRISDLEISTHHDDVIFENLYINNPKDEILIKDINLSLPRGSTLLIKGPSGVGKTTLLRTIAGLWPYSSGKICCPQSRLFLSQKPYIPQGTLLEALSYPDNATNHDDLTKEIRVLREVQLGHLASHLREVNDWARVLSQGEQQRLAFARLLIQEPVVAFLDEATSSMDEGLEDAMYRLIQEKLPNSTIISVGHRPTLFEYHQLELSVNRQHSWELRETKRLLANSYKDNDE